MVKSEHRFTEQELSALVRVYDLLISLADKAEREKTMESVTVTIGSVQSSSSGTATLDTTQDVEFQGELLATYSEPGTDRNGNPTDTRGSTQSLYRASDGRLIVQVCDWSHWQGEPTTYQLLEVTENDLRGRGEFAALGREAGMSRPLTLDEALQRNEYSEPGAQGQILREDDVHGGQVLQGSVWAACAECGEPLGKGPGADLCDDCAPTCAECGKPLLASQSPEYTGGVHLCEDCAEPDS